MEQRRDADVTNGTDSQFPSGMHVLERGWLSFNSILFAGLQSTALVDSRYGRHADQTVQLVSAVLQGRKLDILLNTHLHSDHCGANAALQARFPELRTLIPPGQSSLVSSWDLRIMPGRSVDLPADVCKETFRARHHSVILFEPTSRTLISADALGEKGFGVVFPELEGESAFDAVATTFDLIERLGPRQVIPGHGSSSSYRSHVLTSARDRHLCDPQW